VPTQAYPKVAALQAAERAGAHFRRMLLHAMCAQEESNLHLQVRSLVPCPLNDGRLRGRCTDRTCGLPRVERTLLPTELSDLGGDYGIRTRDPPADNRAL
jgi:hypothetical protein